MVANPKALSRGIPRDGFAKAQMRRTKTDAVDAEVIADYARRMPFEAREPPTETVRDLQSINAPGPAGSSFGYLSPNGRIQLRMGGKRCELRKGDTSHWI